MDSAQLDLFTQVVDLGSFNKAAERNYLSPMSVKRKMDALETEAGVRLLERGSCGVRTTPAGLLLYERAQTIVSECASALRDVRALEAGTIRIAANPLAHAKGWHHIIARFSTVCPRCTVTLVPIATVDYARALSEGLCDTLLTCRHESFERDNLVLSHPFTFKVVCAVAKTSILACRSGLGPRDFAGLPVGGSPYSCRQPLLQLEAAGVGPVTYINMHGDSYYRIFDFIRHGGCYIIPLACIDFLEGEFSIVDLDPTLSDQEIFIASRCNPPGYLREFIECAYGYWSSQDAGVF